MFKVDLHTHSEGSPDGGVTLAQYAKVLDSGALDLIAITDHNRIDYAQAIQSQLGDRIIVGEEIMTTHGEIVGLYLQDVVPAGLTPLDTVKQIKDQGGLVYIPHPFETVRKGLHPATLDELVDYIDIVEVCNGRAFLQNRSSQAVVWTKLNQKSPAASSDAHGVRGLGRTYTDFTELPTKGSFLHLLDTAVLRTSHPSFRSLLYPKYHRLRKKLKGTS